MVTVADGGGLVPQSVSAISSVGTTRLAASSSAASNVRWLPCLTGITFPPQRTSSGPSRPNSITMGISRASYQSPIINANSAT